MINERELTKNIIADFAEAYSSFGLNPLMGRIVALLIISKKPRSLDGIAESLEMSKGPISQICRRLKDRNLIEKVWIPGDRKDYYKTTNDIFGKAFENQMEKMRRNVEIAQRYSEETNSIDNEEAEYAHARMQEMKRFYELMDEHNNAFLEAWGKIHDQEFSS
jgi:DNA-binding transcriptional regulator GbsR (MarR family)